MSAETTEIPEAANANPLVLRLREILSSCSKSIGGGDDTSLSELVNFLETISGSASADPCDDDAQNNAFEILCAIHRFMLSSNLDQEAMDALSFELPKAVSKFSGLSIRCLEIADRVIDRFIEACSPRDMLSIICGALDSTDSPVYSSGYVASLLSGLAKVFRSIERRHFEQVKVATPVILHVLKATCSELVGKAARSEMVDENEESMILFGRALGIADSIQAICEEVWGPVHEKLRALLGLYVLQVLALLSFNEGDRISSYLHLVSRLSKFFQYCSLSYHGLITGSDVDIIVNLVIQDDRDDFMSCLSYIEHGASLAVIWGHVYDDVADVANQNMSFIKDELRCNQSSRWQAIGMLKHILTSTNMLWKLKEHTINFLLWITDGSLTPDDDHTNCPVYTHILFGLRTQEDDHTNCSVYLPSLFVALQAITKVIMYAPNAELRKNAFEALKRVLADSPTSRRYNMVKALITNSDSSSMVAIILDLVRGELHKEKSQRISMKKDALQAKNQDSSSSSLWTAEVLGLVEIVLRSPLGGPHCLTENGDAVLAALNLYRFLLITESTGKTNYTDVLSRNNLQKAYNEWLVPLRTLVTGITAQNKNDCDQLAADAVCSLNPVELVLHRCIELVEENLKHSA